MRKIWPWTYVRVEILPSFYFLFQSWDKCALWRGFVRRRMNILIVGDQRCEGWGQLREVFVGEEEADDRGFPAKEGVLHPHTWFGLEERREERWIRCQKRGDVSKWQWTIILDSVEKRWEIGKYCQLFRGYMYTSQISTIWIILESFFSKFSTSTYSLPKWNAGVTWILVTCSTMTDDSRTSNPNFDLLYKENQASALGTLAVTNLDESTKLEHF